MYEFLMFSGFETAEFLTFSSPHRILGARGRKIAGEFTNLNSEKGKILDKGPANTNLAHIVNNQE